MQPDGVGNLHLAYEQLKVRLEEEGLFLKFIKAIPPYAKTIGVITSPTGAAIRDIITTIKRRYQLGMLLYFRYLYKGSQRLPRLYKRFVQRMKWER